MNVAGKDDRLDATALEAIRTEARHVAAVVVVKLTAAGVDAKGGPLQVIRRNTAIVALVAAPVTAIQLKGIAIIARRGAIRPAGRPVERIRLRLALEREGIPRSEERRVGKEVSG